MRGGAEGHQPPRSEERPSTSLLENLVSLGRMLGEGLVGVARVVSTVVIALFTLAALLAPYALVLRMLLG